MGISNCVNFYLSSTPNFTNSLVAVQLIFWPPLSAINVLLLI